MPSRSYSAAPLAIQERDVTADLATARALGQGTRMRRVRANLRLPLGVPGSARFDVCILFDSFTALSVQPKTTWGTFVASWPLFH